MNEKELTEKRDSVADKDWYWKCYEFVEKEFGTFKGMAWETKMALVLEKYETSGGKYNENKGTK